ncbi:TnsA endonuclease N-terminal domain-containing protein [Streptomyces sp. NPDC005151]
MPFQLSWTGPDGKTVRHTPDFFVRRLDGTGLVVDVRPDNRIEPRDAMKFAATAAACRLVGWDFASNCQYLWMRLLSAVSAGRSPVN